MSRWSGGRRGGKGWREERRREGLEGGEKEGGAGGRIRKRNPNPSNTSVLWRENRKRENDGRVDRERG